VVYIGISLALFTLKYDPQPFYVLE
jgi:hypothetical protein